MIAGLLYDFYGFFAQLGDLIPQEACKAAKSHGVKISCDLNYRGKLWTREQAREAMVDAHPVAAPDDHGGVYPVPPQGVHRRLAKGVKISCDLNYRGKLWTREQAREAMTDLCQYVDVCISNEEDAKDVFGIEADNTDIYGGEINHEGYKAVALGLPLDAPGAVAPGQLLHLGHSDHVVVPLDGVLQPPSAVK